ncbi:integrase core domain-containing protein [Burkholderia mallei]|uniref:integrase core domain-containing protein n=1 Tax=Burkholderia mallei TaxID=13373 RepID=UPI0039EE4F31
MRTSNRSTASSATNALTSTGSRRSRTLGQSSRAWRQDYNEQRPHSALNYLAPSEFAAKHRATADAPAAFQELV